MVFGEVVEGQVALMGTGPTIGEKLCEKDIVKKIEALGTQGGTPQKTVKIRNSGVQALSKAGTFIDVAINTKGSFNGQEFITDEDEVGEAGILTVSPASGKSSLLQSSSAEEGKKAGEAGEEGKKEEL